MVNRGESGEEEVDIEGAKALLEEAGWTVGGSGVREKDGVQLKMVFQTSVNAVRQDFQALIKQWWNDIGVEVELRNVDAAAPAARTARPSPPASASRPC